MRSWETEVNNATRAGMVLRSLTIVLVVTLLAPACGGSKTGSRSAAAVQPGAKLSLVAYSTPKEAYEKLIKAFNQTPEGRNTTFAQSYGASGDQSRAVESGLAADIVAFSLEPDMTRL